MRPTLQRILFSGARIPLPVWVAQTVQSYEQTVNVLSTAARNRLIEALTNDPYYYANFGRRNTADWLFVLQTSIGTTSARTISKSGATLRWDCDGTIFNQNNLPAYSRGANNGILICSTTDGWAGVTQFRIFSNQFSGVAPNWNLPNCTIFRIDDNSFSGTAPNWNLPNCTQFYIFSNNFSGVAPNWNLPNCTQFHIYSNSFNSLGGVGWVLGTNNIKDIRANNNLLPQSSVDLILSTYHTHRVAMAALPGNLNIALQTGNAAPSATGLSNRADIINAFTAAGKTATITTS
jgi:hypothetical protein